MISYISRLQDKSSEFVESNIQSNSRGMYSSSITATSDTSPFRKICITSPESNQTNPQKVSIFFMGENKTHEMTTSTDTRLTVLITDITISEGLYFNLSHKPRFKKVLDLEITMSKSYQTPKRNLISKDFWM